MKNNSPIKRHPAIVSFSKDHHFGLLQTCKIRQGLKNDVSPERIRNYVICFFYEDLKKHFREEEAPLFSKLTIENGLRRKAEPDHKSILQLLSAIKKDKSNTTLLSKMADEVEKHIRFEKRELFNYFQMGRCFFEIKK